MRNARDARGMGLLEALLASAILGGLVYFATSVTVNINVAEKGIERRSSFGKIARSLVQEIVSRQANQPGFARTGAFLDPDYKPFDDVNVATQTCFSVDGSQVDLTAANCSIKASYYRLQMADGRFPAASDLAKIPLYRIYMRFSYFEDEGGKPTAKEFYISQFMTPTLTQ